MRIEKIGPHTLYLGDCREILPTLGKVDAVVTDPPYGIGAARGAHSNLKMVDLDWDDHTPDLTPFLSMDVPMIVWGGNYFPLKPSRGFLVWDKHPMPPSYAFGELAWTNLDMNASVWRGKVGDETAVKDRAHPTQKPVGLMKWCLSHIPNAKLVLDPFMGSGTTGVACAVMGREFVGIELHEPYFDAACERIRKAYAQPDMFVEPAKPAEQLSLMEAAE